MKTPEEIKKGLECCHVGGCECGECHYQKKESCMHWLKQDALAYIQQLELDNENKQKRIEKLETGRYGLFDDLSAAYYSKQMYGLNDDGTVYSRYSCDTMSFEQAVDEFRRLIADE